MNRMRAAAQGVYRLLYRHRRSSSLLVYLVATTAAYVTAYLLRFEFVIPEAYWHAFRVTLPILLAVRVGIGFGFKVGIGRWRFVGTRDLARLLTASTAGTVVFLMATRWNGFLPRVPLSVILIEWALSFGFTGAIWVSYRMAVEHVRNRSIPKEDRKRVLVVGAGEAGHLLVHEMLRMPTGFRPVGFVDDDALKRGSSIHGIEVLGTVAEVDEVARSAGAEELVIATPSATPAELRRIVSHCEDANVSFKLLPGIQAVLEGRVTPDHLRSVEVEDLLGRDPITLDVPELREDLQDEVVLITGAAGSIGSELARQVVLHRPRTVVLVDQAETPLYFLDMELRERAPDVDLHPVIADVTDKAQMEDAFGHWRPSRVYHAAAYKHVPMMESNPTQALRTNFLGTWRVMEAAGAWGAERFVLISTDKAVAPVSVMGASKRLAEMLLPLAEERFPSTAFGAVRFGNVLGSNGSVLTVFRRQLDEGKPLTVTHPEVTRYFMTVSEACLLILEASVLPEFSGRTAMLDMGEPVRIVDLARDILRLSGRPFEEGRSVVYTGLRPGEKLHERLTGDDERPIPTALAKVHLVLGSGQNQRHSARVVDLLEYVAEGYEETALHEALGIFPELTTAPPARTARRAVQELEA